MMMMWITRIDDESDSDSDDDDYDDEEGEGPHVHEGEEDEIIYDDIVRNLPPDSMLARKKNEWEKYKRKVGH